MIERLEPIEPCVPFAEINPSGNAPAIDDTEIHEILARLGVILHDQIADAHTFFMRGGGYDHRLAVPMDATEVAVWESVFSIDKVVGAAIANRSLFLVDIDDAPDALPETSRQEESAPAVIHAPSRQQESEDSVRVNYGRHSQFWVPRELVTVVESTDDLTNLIKPEIHFGGHSHTRGQLYNAFVALDTYVQAPNGTQLVSVINGTGIPNTPSHKPVYSPHTVIGASLWMNTSVEEGGPNSLSVRSDTPEYLMLSSAINDIGTLPSLAIPESDKLRTWFWQIGRMISNKTLALSPASAQTEIE